MLVMYIFYILIICVLIICVLGIHIPCIRISSWPFSDDHIKRRKEKREIQRSLHQIYRSDLCLDL